MSGYTLIIWTADNEQHRFAFEAPDEPEACSRAKMMAAGFDFELLNEAQRLIAWGPTGALFKAA